MSSSSGSTYSSDSDSDGTISEGDFGVGGGTGLINAARRGAGLNQLTARVKQNIELQMIAPLGVYTEVSLTHFEDANNIYVRWGSGAVAENVNVSAEELMKLNLELLKHVNVNDYCLVQYDGDKQNQAGVYRGLCTRLRDTGNPPSCKVLLVDTGVSAWIPKNMVYRMPDHFKTQRRRCFKFGLLRYAQVDSKTAKELCQQYFCQLFSEKKIFVQVKATAYNEVGDLVRQLGEVGVSQVEGFDDVTPEKSFYNTLLERGCVVDYRVRDFLSLENQAIVPTLFRRKIKERDRLSMGRPEKVWIDPDVTSLNDFNVIKLSQKPKLTEIEDLIERMDSVGLNSYTPWEGENGEWCLSRKLHGHSDKWYRARVISISGGDAKIELLDTGGIGVAKMGNLKNMPSRLRNIPALGIQCSMPVQAVEDNDVLVIINNFKNLNDLDIEILAHMIGHVRGYKVEVDLEIRNFQGESLSLSQRMVDTGQAVWSNIEYAQNEVNMLIPMDLETSESESNASVYESSHYSETASTISMNETSEISDSEME